MTVYTVDGTATAGSDYTAVNRRVTFRPNYTVAWVAVPIIDDTRDEPNETFMLQMSAPSSNAQMSTATQAESTILDDDIGPPGAVLNLSVDCSTVGTNGEIAISWLPGTGTPPTGFQVEVEYPSYHWSTNPSAFAITSVGATAQAHTFTGISDGWGTYRIVVTAFVPGAGGGVSLSQLWIVNLRFRWCRCLTRRSLWAKATPFRSQQSSIRCLTAPRPCCSQLRAA